MPVFAIYKFTADTCGNEDVVGPIQYVEADNIRDIEELFPRGFLTGYYTREINIETIGWLKIQAQLGAPKFSHHQK